MSLFDAFDSYQQMIDEDASVVATARDRREKFKTAFKAEGDVTEVWSSGSLRRGTQLAPLNDLDLVVVYDQAQQPTWGQPGSSASEALEHVGKRVTALLGINDGSSSKLVRRAHRRDHAVKCFIDAPNSGFTVDVMPALRIADGTLLIPEDHSQDWVGANPEYLIAAVQKRHDDWAYYRPMVRVLKDWRLDAAKNMDSKVKSLVIEILALTCLPTSGSRPEGLAKFFTAAAVAVGQPICDPAELCGETQPDLDYDGLRRELVKARDHANDAVLCARDGNVANAQRLWQLVFGPDFPAPAGPITVGAAAGAAAAAGATQIGYQPVKDSPQG